MQACYAGSSGVDNETRAPSSALLKLKRFFPLCVRDTGHGTRDNGTLAAKQKKMAKYKIQSNTK